MARPDKISRFLPIYFSNGNSVRRFGKHCPNCEVMVGAQHMEGLASKHDERIFLAATACCPSCSHKFSVGCVITDDKRVHRVCPTILDISELVEENHPKRSEATQRWQPGCSWKSIDNDTGGLSVAQQCHPNSVRANFRSFQWKIHQRLGRIPGEAI